LAGDGNGHSGSASRAGFAPFGRKPLRMFALTIGLPALLLYVSSALLVIAALVMMAREIDRLEEQRALTAMAAALETFLYGLSDAVADEGSWNEAHLNVVIKPDPAWMDGTWGTTARLGTTYDDVFVTNPEGVIIFGENNLGAITGTVADHYPTGAAMLEELDNAITSSGDAAVVSHFVADKNQSAAGLAAISIHQSTPGEMAVPRHQRRILWIAKHMTPAILQEMALRYQVPLPHFVTEAEPGMSVISITDGAGNVAGRIGWFPDRPGDVAFRHTAIVVFSLLAVIGVPLVLGLGALRRAMTRRAARIEAAFEEQVRDSQVAVAAAEVVAAARPVEEIKRQSVIESVSASVFAVEYQPIFDLRAESLIGVETLLRWTKPDKTLLLQEELSPEDTAAIMERAGIMALRHAAGEIAPLLGVTLSLAMTAEQVLSGVFAEKVGGTLIATNFQIRRLQLHTDVTLLPDVETVRPFFAELRRMGATVALSNFVLSEQTVQYMQPGLVDRIFLSRSMVAGIDAEPARLKLLEATVETARQAELAVTVPHIERKEEASRLLRLGCREFRGPLLAGAMPLAALTSLILAPAKPAAKAG
jgi:EAL domain-containing protein (putative c-di-GMP-specific phosphodiesterase class I)